MCGDPVCEDPLTLISTKCPWLITRNIEAEAESDQMNQGEESLCIVNDDEQVRFECRIPEIVGRRIRGCYHGWIILSKKQHHNNNSSSSSNYNYKNVMMWSLWNPVTSKFIRLPPLLLKTGDSDDDILFCCLSSDPDHPNSILLLRIRNKPNLVFFRLGKRKKKSRRWIEMSYAGQFKSFGGFDDGSLNFLTCSNDMTNTTSTWEEIKDLKDAVFYVDIAENMCVYYNRAATSELGGYIHVRSTVYSKIFSYHLKERTVSVIAMPPLGFSSYLSLWECRLEGDDGEARHTIEYKLKKDMIDDEISIITSIKNDDDGVVAECYNSMANESHLVSIPFHILERIMEFCVGIEFLMFRATCKLCHLAAPLMNWRVVPKLRSYTTTAS
ncbi:uncharacterized protein [Rutidosis leptorrhynchoides]|uniref:uncharacterized protein n=1 Tax=Rutidosis leptorrhynchoides TaxID=125765 RepID=UPI003A9977F5